MGVGAAAFYFRRKERQREYERSIINFGGSDRKDINVRPEVNAERWGQGYHRFDRSEIPTSQPGVTHGNSAFIPALNAAQTAQPITTEKDHSWGWASHRRGREARRAAGSEKAQANRDVALDDAKVFGSSDLEAAMEKLWKESMPKTGYEDKVQHHASPYISVFC